MPALLALTGLMLVALMRAASPTPLHAARWWLAAAPCVASGGALLLHLAGFLPRTRRPLADAASAIAAACALGLAFAARAALRERERRRDDATGDDAIVEDGPYARIRHPLSAACMLLLAASALALPSAVTCAALACGVVALSLQARSQDRLLLRSPHGDRYADYVRRTGRFAPRLGRGP